MKWENVYKVIETLVGNKVDLSYLEIKDKYLIEKLTDQMHMEIMTKKLHTDNSNYPTLKRPIAANVVRNMPPWCNGSTR